MKFKESNAAVCDQLSMNSWENDPIYRKQDQESADSYTSINSQAFNSESDEEHDVEKLKPMHEMQKMDYQDL